MAPPPEKKARTEGQAPEQEEEKPDAPQEPDVEMKDAETKEEAPKEPEPPKEMEQDAAPEKAKPRIKEEVKFLVQDTTLNVMQSTTGNLLMTLCDGGIQHLLAGAKANVGIKSGRYMFEVKIVEYMNPVQDHAYRGAPGPKNLVRVGFSTSAAPLIMGELSEGFVCFDSEGAFMQPKKRTPVASRFVRDEVVAVLLNLDENSPNYNTISLFKNGVRVSQPQQLPESLKGEVLYPTVSFKQMTLHVNFGLQPIVPLPFVCRMVKDISVKDAQVTATPKDGKNEVVFPVGLPDEGAFDWLDLFHEKNPGYCELSDRMILDWAEKSGIWRNKGYKAKTSNDKPEMAFGIRELDDGSVRRVINSVAPLQARNFVVMEMRGNLIKKERTESIVRFPINMFKKTAQVIVGEPTADFKKKTNELVLKAKQEQADLEFKAKKAEEMRAKLMEKRAKELEKAKKKAEKERKKAEKEIKKKLEAEKKAQEEAAKKAEEEKKAAEGGEVEKKEGEDETMEDKRPAEDEKKEEEEEEKKEEEKKEEEKKEEEEEEEEEDEEEAEEPEKEEVEEEPPKVTLTAEEKKITFFKASTPDLTPYVLSTSLASFSLPIKDEGFDEIKYEWNKTSTKAQEYLKSWISDKKLTTRAEDLQPSEWFKTKWAEWQKVLQQWHAKHGEYKALLAQKEAAKAAKKALVAAKEAAKEAAAKMEAAKEEAKEAAKEGEEAKEGEPVPMEEDKKEEEAQEEKKEEEEMEQEEETMDFETLDVFGVDDVMDIGAGTPLYKDFQSEDWTMLSLRFELHLLAHAFRHDVEDVERAGIHLDHLAYYYNKYYKKALTSKSYGVETFKELVDLVNDAVYVTKKQVLESQLDAEMESLQIFAKLTEEARRYRSLRLALGEESARLKLTQPMQLAPVAQGQRAGKRGPKGGWYGDSKGASKGGKSSFALGGGFQQQQQHYTPPRQQLAPRTVAPRTVAPPAYRQSWNDSKGKGK